MAQIHIRRVYDPTPPSAGTRVLVDRFWPRGIKKEQLGAPWLRDAAPSPALCKWYGHDPTRWDEFRNRYFTELDGRPQAVAQLLDLAASGPLILLFSARELERNQAAALRDYLLRRIEEGSGV